MKNFAIVLAVLVLGGLAYYFLVMRPAANEDELKPPPLVEQPAPVEPAKVETPTVSMDEAQSPGSEPAAQSLPALSDSDPVVRESLAGLVGEKAVQKYVVSENLVAHIVATIDTLTSRQVSANLMPLEPPGGQLKVTEDRDPADAKTTPEGVPVKEFLLDPANYARYVPYVELLESVNTDQLIATYTEYRPWFQQAYVDLGYPGGDFNARLLEVIDQLLDAPDAQEPVHLVKPEAYYLFADPQLEALTAGQKIMIRMGSSNAQRVKRKLAEIRAALDAVSTIK